LPVIVATELARLEPRRVVVLGGTSAVSDAVVAQLRGYLALP
jgi:putative cell wall-binding protein